MKTILKIFVALLLFTSCKSISYDGAVSANKDKFYGDEEKTALLLVDFKNLSQAAADISDLAPNHAYSKDLCDFAGMVISDQQSRKMPLKLLALKEGVKLPTVVGRDEQKIYHQMQAITDEKSFDKAYCENEKVIFSKILDKCDSFLTENNEGPVRDYLVKQTGIYKSYQSKINLLQNYIEKKEPQQLTEN
jgi:predicted outer membrane protein